MADSTSMIIDEPEQVTASWLGAVLGCGVAAVEEVSRIGTGQMSRNVRVRYRDAEGSSASVVVKLPSDDENSRGTGVGMGAYRREIEFYRRLADRVRGPVPECHLAEYEEADGRFTLVLADIRDAVAGDQVAGCSIGQAELAVRELARLQAPVFNDLALSVADYLNIPTPITGTLMATLLPGFLDRYADRIAPEHVEICRRYVEVADAWAADRRPPLGLVHGDFRPDNLLFTTDGCVVVDWQTLTWGPAVQDLSYFLGGALTPADRGAHESRLVRSYHDELVAHGVQNFDWDTCWDEYRRQTFWALAMTIVPAMVVVRTDRGDDMFMAIIERVCSQINDLDSLDLLPAVGAPLAVLRPEPSDEQLHAPGTEALWNESRYFDVAARDGSIGFYTRLGRLPNQGAGVYTAAIVRPGRPTVMVVDHAVGLPSPDDVTEAVASSFTATMECAEPLRRYRIRISGQGELFDDDAAPLRGEAGKPVSVEVDLSWHTDGVPYSWRASTRYEIPCRVTGTITVDGVCEQIDAPGQRDHSWGSRDWWANDWSWSAFHLDDGTRTHSVTVPELPGFAVGYTQRDGQIAEWTGGTTEQVIGSDGLIRSAVLRLQPGGVELAVEPLGFGALRMVSPDGSKVAHFPRALARVRSGDGVDGIGWIEWNVNQQG